MLGRLQTHVETKHKEITIDRHFAQRLTAGFCEDCKRLGVIYPDGRLPGHEHCPSQEKFRVDDVAKKNFAKSRDADLEAQHVETVASLLGASEDTPIGEKPKKRNAWVTDSLARLADYASASNSRDFIRMDEIAEWIIKNPLEKRKEKYETTRPTHSDPEADAIHRAARVLRIEGLPGKALNKLRSSALFKITRANEHLMRNLHPRRKMPMQIPADVGTNPTYAFELDERYVDEVLGAKSKETGRGMSNWGYGDLQTLWKNPEARKHLMILLNDMANDRLPRQGVFSKQMRFLRGVALQKKNPNEARPIGVREVFANLVSAAQNRQLEKDIKANFGPNDFGYRVKNGTIIPALTAQSIINEARQLGKNLFLIKIDLTNAYGTTPRAVVANYLVKHLPKMVRLFLATHENPSTIKYEGMDTFEIEEGLTQGDALAPAYSNLIYASVCEEIRENFRSMRMIGSYFDDIFIIGEEFTTTLDCFEALRDKFAEIEMIVNAQKCVLFTLQPLDQNELKRLNEVKIPSTTEGVDIAGTPVGLEPFIEKELSLAKNKVISILDKIHKMNRAGSFNQKFSTTQGSYHLVRDCVNQICKHLLRAVDPKLTKVAFAELDEKTLETTIRLFGKPEELTPIIRARIGLPGKLGGLGITSYVKIAEAAYIGSLASIGTSIRNGFQNGAVFSHHYVVGCEEAQLFLAQKLPESREMVNEKEVVHPSPVPSIDDIFSKPGEKVQLKLTKALHEKTKADLLRTTTGPYKFFLQVANNETAADVFFARISTASNRFLSWEFQIIARRYLGLSVTGDTCGVCGETVSQHGQHLFHVQNKVTNRHHAVKDALFELFRRLFSSGNSQYYARKEIPLPWLGYELRSDAKDKSIATCDIAFIDPSNNRTLVGDVLITEPKFEDINTHNSPLVQALKGVDTKYDRYVDNWAIDKKEVLPLVFESTGGYAPTTWSMLNDIAAGVARDDAQLKNRIMRAMRDRIAIQIHRGNVWAICALNDKDPKRFRIRRY